MASSGELAIIACTIFLIFVQVAAFVAAIDFKDLPRLFRVVARWARAQVNLWTRLHETQQLDLISQQALTLMTHRREESMKAFCFSLSYVFTIAMVFVLFHRISGANRWMTLAQHVILLVCLVLLITANTFPSSIRGKAAHRSLFGIFILLLVSWVALGSNLPEDILLCSMSAWLIRLALSMICLDVRMAAVLNIICCITNSFHHIRAVERDERSCLIPRNYIFFDAASIIYILLLAWGVQRVTYAGVRQEIEAKARKIEQSAVMMLLDMVCDVVLSLDSGLQMVDHSPRFSAMLMMEPTRSLQGLEFQNFISSEVDQSRFKSCLLHTSFDMEFASRALNVSMRESSGTSFNVETLIVPFQGLDNSTHYMVGIREISDLQPAPLRSSTIVAKPCSDPNPLGQTSPNVTTSALQPNCLTASEQGVAHGHRVNPVAANAEAMDSDLESSIGSEAPRGKQLVLPSLKETSFKAKQITMCEMLAAWNVEIPKRSCCTFHAYLQELRTVLRRSRGARCLHNLHDQDVSSCPECGVLGRLDEEERCCSVCGQECEPAGISL